MIDYENAHDTNGTAVDTLLGSEGSDELTIHLRSSHLQVNAMSDESKFLARQKGPALMDLFIETMKSKGGSGSVKSNWLDHSEVEVRGMSHMTLHSFLLEAEKLGKNLEYVKTLTVKITD